MLWQIVGLKVIPLPLAKQERARSGLTSDHFLQILRIAGPFDLDVRRRIFDLAEIFGRKLDIRRSLVFFEPM